MKYTLTLFLTLLLINGCGDVNGDNNSQKTGKADMNDLDKPRATGIGGIFFKAKDPEAMKKWYGEHFGMKMNEYGTMFEFRSTDDPDKKGYLQWSPFSEKTTYFAPSEKDYMINYRVHNIEKLVENLKEAGVEVVDTIETYDYGKFVHVLDPEGNKLELWEPVDETFTKEYEGDTSH